jgi:hypothetical protein
MDRRALNALIRIMEARPRLRPEDLARRLDRELKIGPTAANELMRWIVDNRFLAICPETGDVCLDLVQEVAPAADVRSHTAHA